MRKNMKKCLLLLLATLLLLSALSGCGASKDADDADGTKSEEKSDPGDKTKSDVKTLLGDKKNDAYLTIELDGKKYDFTQNYDTVVEELAKNGIPSLDQKGGYKIWDTVSDSLQTVSVLGFESQGDAKEKRDDKGLIYSLQEQPRYTVGYNEENRTMVYCPCSENDYLFASSLNAETHYWLASNKMSFRTPDGITEKSRWDDVLSIKGGLGNSEIPAANNLFNLNMIYANLLPQFYFFPGKRFAPSAREECNAVATYLVIYEDGKPVNLDADQFEKDFDSFRKDGKSLLDYYNLYFEPNDYEKSTSYLEQWSNTTLKDFWAETTENNSRYKGMDFHNKITKDLFFQLIAINASMQKYLRGEINEVAFITYATYTEEVTSGIMDNDGIGECITYYGPMEPQNP